MKRALWFLSQKKLKNCKQELIKFKETKEAENLLFYLFDISGEGILEEISRHYSYNICECRHPYRFILGTPPTCDDYIMKHEDFEDFKGFLYCMKWRYYGGIVVGDVLDDERYHFKTLAIEHLQTHQVLPCLTYLPLYYLTKDLLYLKKAVDAGIPRACYEMYKVTKEFTLLKYASKIIRNDEIWNCLEENTYLYFKYYGVFL